MAAPSEHRAVALAKKHEDYHRLSIEYQRRFESSPVEGNRTKIPVKQQTPITSALDKIQTYPFVSFTLGPSETKYNLVDPDAEWDDTSSFGELTAPDVGAILEASQPSSFGKGDQTVYDTNYRNGREIPADAVKFREGYEEKLSSKIKRVLCSTLFIGKTVKLVFYKLALYEKGGHFNWHRDSTHGDNHHGTVLVALNTSWEGGRFHLCHNGAETHFDMHPVIEKDPQTRTTTSISLRVVAFYTDVEHKVETVTEGVRLVLQYDVFIQQEDEYPEYQYLRIPNSQLFTEHFEPVADAQGPKIFYPAALKDLSDAISDAHERGTGEVSIPLRHLYRQASIRPEYLKGVDAVVYENLSQTFKVSLLPILLLETVFGDGGVMTAVVKYDGESSRNERLFQPVRRRYRNENDSDTASEGEQGQNLSKRISEFHMSGCTDLLQISKEDYQDHAGNEPQNGSASYFGGGMFICAKDSME
ncbi:uncharacterized protein EV420DRAFT_1508864 [Desarmillaria tabescens]|uniref:Fe2OG dioxygenase domain-containing protein n=1 Tax=Armillaria tabescens TaxID=1929756 RepID=A0AA39NHW5_ARMTA|nr:uncharacterized protein EV420DRAFT_1508864 [Desarmillaria tabescens]KAK0465932.1 hypothetical protein EV420DRAFT_1508864 [Desarmillaria tabescens]